MSEKFTQAMGGLIKDHGREKDTLRESSTDSPYSGDRGVTN